MVETLGGKKHDWTFFLAAAALLLSFLSLIRPGASRASLPTEQADSWRIQRQYPPLVFSSKALLECSISATATGRQAMTTTSGQGFTFDTPMLPLKKSELKLISQSGAQAGMMYKFDAFPAAAFPARFSGLGEGTIIEMKSEVEVSVSRFSQAGGPGTPIHFTAEGISPDSAYVEFTGVFVRTSDRKPFPFRVLFSRVEEGNGLVVPGSIAPVTNIMSKMVNLGSLQRPASVMTALYEAEEDVAKLKMP
jgi:hypothetical protein